MLPQTSSSQEVELLLLVFWAVTAFALPPEFPLLPLPTRLSKSTATVGSAPAAPLTAVADLSSIRWASRRNWLCSLSTLSPSFFITAMKRWNCSTFSTDKVDLVIDSENKITE